MDSNNTADWKGELTMTMIGQRVTLRAGDTRTLEITVQDVAPEDFDGATATWRMGILDPAGTDTVLAEKTGTFDGVTISIPLDPTDTVEIKPGTYSHECRIVAASGAVVTVTVGPFILEPTFRV